MVNRVRGFFKHLGKTKPAEAGHGLVADVATLLHETSQSADTSETIIVMLWPAVRNGHEGRGADWLLLARSC